MKTKKIGKVHPFPSSNGNDCLSVLKLLPAVILLLVSSLSADEREVLAYLVTRSLKTTTEEGERRSAPSDSKKSNSKKKKISHKPPVFDCECFDCYTSYWFRWDSSPNRELINQIIEAFEDHLTTSENSVSQNSKRNNVRGKKKEQAISKTTEPVNPDESGSIMKTMTTKYKSLARKLLPDLLGLFNSRFWSLWYPKA